MQCRGIVVTHAEWQPPGDVPPLGVPPEWPPEEPGQPSPRPEEIPPGPSESPPPVTPEAVARASRSTEGRSRGQGSRPYVDIRIAASVVSS